MKKGLHDRCDTSTQKIGMSSFLFADNLSIGFMLGLQLHLQTHIF